MKSDFKRSDRVAELLQQELAQLIPREIIDPNFPKFVTLSLVKVAPNLSDAWVYFTVFAPQSEDMEQAPDKALQHKTVVNETSKILNRAAGYLRSLLTKSIKLRTMPRLHFIYDEALDYSRNLSRLIDRVTKDVDLSKDETASQDEDND